MSLNQKELQGVANLAKLELDQNEEAQYTDQLSAVLQYVAELQKIDVSKVEPVGQVTGLTNQLAKDVVKECEIPRDKLLANAPAQEKGYVKVKSIFGRAT
ncbi:MAG: Asp-tRNA(Asn)/Glu-tRNA(Gln) amidotransferase subunit GatC [Patescibacteria group bacterium]